MAESMIIREATIADSQEWGRMRTLLWADTDDEHASEIAEFFAGESIDIVQVFVVQREDGRLAGFIEINVRNFAEGSRSPEVPYIEGWFVDADVRGKGYGRKLMQRAESWARDAGFSELASDTEIENTASIAIHQKLGFKETDRVVCFLKKLV